MQSFSLPGESQKAAKILASFLGEPPCLWPEILAHTQLIRRDRGLRLIRYRKLFCNELKVSG
jgi:hypothetical protein